MRRDAEITEDERTQAMRIRLQMLRSMERLAVQRSCREALRRIRSRAAKLEVNLSKRGG